MFAGQNLNFSVGMVSYQTGFESDSSSSDNLLVIIIAVAASGGGVLLVASLVIIMVVCVYRSKSKAKDKRLTNLLAQMELWEIEMADECKRGEDVCIYRLVCSNYEASPQ